MIENRSTRSGPRTGFFLMSYLLRRRSNNKHTHPFFHKMSSTKLLFNLFCLLSSLRHLQVKSSCVKHDTELLCAPLNFSVYNISLFNFNASSSIRTVHLTNSYYSGSLAETINKLIIDGYPYETFATTFNCRVY